MQNTRKYVIVMYAYNALLNSNLLKGFDLIMGSSALSSTIVQVFCDRPKFKCICEVSVFPNPWKSLIRYFEHRRRVMYVSFSPFLRSLEWCNCIENRRSRTRSLIRYESFSLKVWRISLLMHQYNKLFSCCKVNHCTFIHELFFNFPFTRRVQGTFTISAICLTNHLRNMQLFITKKA